MIEAMQQNVSRRNFIEAAETAVAGKPRTEATADLAGRLAVEGAVPRSATTATKFL